MYTGVRIQFRNTYTHSSAFLIRHVHKPPPGKWNVRFRSDVLLEWFSWEINFHLAPVVGWSTYTCSLRIWVALVDCSSLCLFCVWSLYCCLWVFLGNFISLYIQAHTFAPSFPYTSVTIHINSTLCIYRYTDITKITKWIKMKEK